MIIDVHTHIFPDAVAKKAIPKLLAAGAGTLTAYTDGTYHGLCRSMEASGVDYSVVLPIATAPDQGRGILSWIGEIQKNHSKILFFGSAHPKDPRLEDTLKGAADLGLKGIKLHPQYQNFAADSAEACRLYEKALKYSLILHFHAGFDIGFPDSTLASARRFAQVKKDFPEARILLAHAGGYREWDEVYRHLSGKGFYFDLSFAIDPLLKRESPDLLKLFDENQDFFLFGSDSPWQDPGADSKKIQNHSLWDTDQKEKILFKNALKLLGPLP